MKFPNSVVVTVTAALVAKSTGTSNTVYFEVTGDITVKAAALAGRIVAQ